MLQKLKDLLTPDVSTEAKLLGVSAFFGKQIAEIDSRLRTQEIRSFIKGDKGDRGERGEPGRDGKDGKDASGKDGKDGKAGKDGRDGKDGVSVVDSSIAADGNLVFTLSDGRIIDAGKIEVGSSGYQINTQVAQDQITVSATAPTNPYVGQLWYDTSV